MSDRIILKNSVESIPIYPTHGDPPKRITPTAAAIVLIGTDVTTVTEFPDLVVLNGGPAVRVGGLEDGTYKVVCKMDLQLDGQEPIWELGGELVIASTV